jgi:hypothetical protein
MPPVEQVLGRCTVDEQQRDGEGDGRETTVDLTPSLGVDSFLDGATATTTGDDGSSASWRLTTRVVDVTATLRSDGGERTSWQDVRRWVDNRPSEVARRAVERLRGRGTSGAA